MSTTIPTLSGAPLLGNLLELRRDWLALLARVPAECGDVGRIRLGPVSGLVFNSPEAVRTIFVDHTDAFDKGPTLARLVRVFLGNGLLTCDRADHAEQRRLVAPAFLPARLNAYAPFITASVDAVCATIPHGAELDLHTLILQIAMAAMGRTLFSDDLAAIAPRLEAALSDGLAWLAWRVGHPLSLPLAVPTRHNRLATGAVRVLDEVLFGLIARRRAAGPGRGDILDHLVEAGATDDRALRDQLATLLLAGFETTAASISWLWALLGEREGLEEAMREEAQGRAGEVRGTGELALTERAWKEGLRLYPPAHTIGRRVERDLEVAGHVVRKGDVVIVSPWLLHRRPEAFPSPEVFDPDRFAPGHTPPRYAWIPFGAGPRVCIGGAFAAMEARIIVAGLLRRFRFERLTSGRPAPIISLTLRPTSLPVRVLAVSP